jgi:hypothetical protein
MGGRLGWGSMTAEFAAEIRRTLREYRAVLERELALAGLDLAALEAESEPNGVNAALLFGVGGDQ